MTGVRKFLRGAALSGAVVFLAGCADDSPTATPSLAVDLALAAAPAAGDAGHPVVLTATARNTGTMAVWHSSECMSGPGIGLRMLGPDGAEVRIRDPFAPVPACADGMVQMAPGESVHLAFEFTGVLYRDTYDPAGNSYPAPPGTYTAVARFGYAMQAWQPGSVVEHSVTFEWGP